MKMQRVAWSPEIGQALAGAARGDLDVIRAEVEHGVSELWHAQHDQGGGYVVTRQEDKELVIVAASGTGCRPVIQHITRRALAAGLGLRTHIQRPGLRRIYEWEGWALDELVMRIRPHGQQ